MRGVCGIDPGLDGGIALISEAGVLVEAMPTNEATKGRLIDLPELTRWLFGHRSVIEVVFIEAAQMRPRQATQATFKCGRGFGQIEGILAALNIPYEIVNAGSWAKVMHAGVEGKTDKKAKSKLAVSRLFPGLDLRASERCKVVHDGMAEAVLIAEYGRRKRQGK